MLVDLPEDWAQLLAGEMEKPYFSALEKFVDAERRDYTVFPPEEDVFTALKTTSYENTKVFLLGQDPYHDNNQAHGLCFSVRPGVRPPPSLYNIYRELKTDIPGFKAPKHGYLIHWAQQGILMLNAVLTVRAHTPNSHKSKGWEKFTDAVIQKVNQKEDRVVFLLWGAYAQKKAPLITGEHHVVIKGVHPSPLSAEKGFFGSQPFSSINKALEEAGKEPIDWQLPEIQ
jgi:uracil-DNA glycosylase